MTLFICRLCGADNTDRAWQFLSSDMPGKFFFSCWRCGEPRSVFPVEGDGWLSDGLGI